MGVKLALRKKLLACLLWIFLDLAMEFRGNMGRKSGQKVEQDPFLSHARIV